MLFNDRSYSIAQCNNIYIFPGLGLGVLASGAERVSDGMLDAAVETLAMSSPALTNADAPLLPLMERIQQVTCDIAQAVAVQAQKEGLAEPCDSSEMERNIRGRRWAPIYRRMHMSFC